MSKMSHCQIYKNCIAHKCVNFLDQRGGFHTLSLIKQILIYESWGVGDVLHIEGDHNDG